MKKNKVISGTETGDENKGTACTTQPYIIEVQFQNIFIYLNTINHPNQIPSNQTSQTIATRFA